MAAAVEGISRALRDFSRAQAADMYMTRREV
jgi:hypothetical protein